MIVKDGKEVHPLRQNEILLGEQPIFKLNARHERSWFILDLALPRMAFVPLGSAGLVTADGLQMKTNCRRN